MGGCWSSSINIAAQIENLKDLEQHKPVARRSYKLSTHPCNSDAPGASNAEYKFYVDTNNERILKRKLRVIRKLGEGGVGCVYLTEDSTVIRCNESPLLYALKVIAASEKTALIRESVELIRDLERECKYIAEIMEDYFLEEENTIYIVLVRN
jgi:serine/threonine protein kinase